MGDLIDMDSLEIDDVADLTKVWCVFGSTAFPTTICCQFTTHDGERVIWGYSIWKRKPGFRTLGVVAKTWAAKNDAKFFLTPAAALNYLRGIITP